MQKVPIPKHEAEAVTHIQMVNFIQPFLRATDGFDYQSIECELTIFEYFSLSHSGDTRTSDEEQQPIGDASSKVNARQTRSRSKISQKSGKYENYVDEILN